MHRHDDLYWKPVNTGLAFVMLFTAPVLTSCKKSESGPGAGGATQAVQAQPDPIDLTRLRAAFASADPNMKVYVDECIGSIRARDFGFAAEQLQKLLRNPKLNQEQREAVQDVINRLRTAKK